MSLIDEVSWPSSTTGSNIGDRYIGSEPLSTLLEFEFEPTLTTKAATTTATEEHPIHGTPKAPSTDKGRKRASDEPFRTTPKRFRIQKLPITPCMRTVDQDDTTCADKDYTYETTRQMFQPQSPLRRRSDTHDRYRSMPAFRTTELLQSSKHMSNIVTHQESPDISGSGFWHAEAAIINKGWSHQSKASLEYDSDRGGQADVHHGTRQEDDTGPSPSPRVDTSNELDTERYSVYVQVEKGTLVEGLGWPYYEDAQLLLRDLIKAYPKGIETLQAREQCLTRSIRGGQSELAVAGKHTNACKKCTSARAPCLRLVEGKVVSLPVCPQARPKATISDPSYWRLAEGKNIPKSWFRKT